MVVIKANITPGDELQTPRSWKVIAGSSQPPPRKTTIFFIRKVDKTTQGQYLSTHTHCPVRYCADLDRANYPDAMLRGDGSGLPARLDSSAEKLTRTVIERREKDPWNSLEWERARRKVPSLIRRFEVGGSRLFKWIFLFV